MSQQAQLLFLKYAFPCAGITLARGHICQKEYDKLERAVKKNQLIDWQTLQKIFAPAFRRIKKMSCLTGQNIFDAQTIRDYYLKYHNKFIDENEGSYKYAPPALKQLCRVERAKIIDVQSDCYIVKIGQKLRPVSKMICLNAKVGDWVSVHYGYAVEKLK
ncbi:MAG: HypC/HybG/HupF family hydrogenase formation chaperone [Patescibacteria group bacterium]